MVVEAFYVAGCPVPCSRLDVIPLRNNNNTGMGEGAGLVSSEIVSTWVVWSCQQDAANFEHPVLRTSYVLIGEGQKLR